MSEHVQREQRLDDLAWFVATGENAEGAARRLGMSREYLAKWARVNCPNLWATLTARDPAPIVGHHQLTRRRRA